MRANAVGFRELAVTHDFLVGIAPLTIGVVMVALLIAAVAYGMRLRRRKPPPPAGPQLRSGSWQTRDELGQPTPPDHGPGHQDRGPAGDPYTRDVHTTHPDESRDNATTGQGDSPASPGAGAGDEPGPSDGR
ncbi:DUF6479 family protein [Streptomyces sp. H39-C1]|uniref:DUF6479 family protein n=1 Tax=Streptomyces sp. H39-C1 TaxID=3004355 RepID=UPI0022AFE83B|nr:DUF6479 family protein [Streptomyces sp. H39-C1]MCZ4103565.1 DUF6479 family protein [Streptomyces sp. H39-C1]